MKLNSIFLMLIIALTFTVQSCNDDDGRLSPDLIDNPNTASGVADKGDLPVIQFVTTEHDFGKIIDGVIVSFTFKFKNVGGSDLIISQVKTSCGCTASKFTKEPVPPGGEGRITLTFNSLHRQGFNNKVATVISNTQPNTHVLKITAMVLAPENM